MVASWDELPPDLRVDVITAFDVLEHVGNPLDVITGARARLRGDGILVIGTITTSSWSWRLTKGRNWYTRLPEHIAFVSEQWLAWAANAAEGRLLWSTRFSHAEDRSIGRVLRQAAANALYLMAPGFFARLRRSGALSELEITDAALERTPPDWMTYPDHVLAVLTFGREIRRVDQAPPAVPA